MIIEMKARGDPIDMVLMADHGSERPETDDFVPLFRAWMDNHGIPNEVVRYEPKRFKHWPPYYSLLENLLTNGTLPSISFGRHSCSQKWKIAPQDRWTEAWQPALSAWARGQKVVKLIGYDCSPADNRRYAEREGHVDLRYEFRCPLRDWGWDRDACIARIRAEGLPIPVKSSCFFCAAMKPHEVRTLPALYLRLIVLIEARAAPRLRTVDGLWRKPIKGRGAGEARPGSMTEFIRAEHLLDPEEVDRIIAEAPGDLLAFQQAAARVALEHREPIGDWIARFNAGLDLRC
ncbi:hypothetical protein D0Z70_14555 [Sphingobium terrigena]|uniref:Phosphoadenosine phosphosulphate reductase domain-containing protein n=1 Tax=Sphingobium terrigena TaxID=2304063 RepID=A0A418YR14_9SPHN|nr:hypothetical protein [Sphingobium terrigena]RJG53986.1 hypothetical protein D0Z70_14555 [Sphingobium terrigena]